MRKIDAIFICCGMALALLMSGGCENTAEGVRQDSAEVGAEAAQAARKVDQKAEEVGREVGAAAKEAGKEVAEATHGAAKEARESLAVSPSILSAFAADDLLNESENKITVTSENGVVYLRGTAMSAAAKQRATEVAKKTLDRIEQKDTIKNEIVVTNVKNND